MLLLLLRQRGVAKHESLKLEPREGEAMLVSLAVAVVEPAWWLGAAHPQAQPWALILASAWRSPV
jgi:hypothetical protein